MSLVTSEVLESLLGKLKTLFDGKVDKVSGKGLSTNDYTTAEKTKLAGIAEGANKTTVDSALSSTSTNPVQNKVVNSALAGKVPTTRTVNGKALSANITLSAADVSAIPTSQKGAASGVAELDASGKVPSAQLPSFVDDVLEGYLSGGKFYKESTHTTEITGETGKIYVDMSTNKTYRWSGTAYTEISASLALGETSSTAYRGDHGKIAYDHSQTAHAPSNAEANVQSDWSVTDAASDAYIKNRPTVMGAATSSAAGKQGFVPAPAAGAQAKYLRGDGTWQTPPNTNTTYTAGTGLALSGTTFSLASSGVTAGSYGPTANVTGSNGTTINVPQITVDAYGRVTSVTNRVLTNQNTNTTYSAMTGATSSAAGTTGLVPAPAAGAQAKFLRGDGTWQTPANTTYSTMKGATSSAAGSAGLVPAPAAGKQASFLRGDGTWVVPTNTTYSVATQSANGLMSSTDKKKLDGMVEMTTTELDTLFSSVFA